MIDLLIAIVWVFAPDGRRVMAPVGLYGRKKMTALPRARHLPDVTDGAVDRGMRYLGLQGIRRARVLRAVAGGGLKVPVLAGAERGGDLDHLGEGVVAELAAQRLGCGALNANIWSPVPPAIEVARWVRAGTVTINAAACA